MHAQWGLHSCCARSPAATPLQLQRLTSAPLHLPQSVGLVSRTQCREGQQRTLRARTTIPTWPSIICRRVQRRAAERAGGRQLCGLQAHLLRAASRSPRLAALLAGVLVLPVSKGGLWDCLAELRLRSMGADAGGDRTTAALEFSLCSNLQCSTEGGLAQSLASTLQTAAPEAGAAGAKASSVKHAAYSRSPMMAHADWCFEPLPAPKLAQRTQDAGPPSGSPAGSQ